MRIETKKIKDMNRAEYNPRVELQPGDEDYESIKYSIDTYGLVQPIVWNERSNNVVGGHQKLNILEAEGVTEVQVSVVDLTDIQEKQLNLALNRVSGRWDNQKLYQLLDELGEDAKKTGFTEEELAVMKESEKYFEEAIKDEASQDDSFFYFTVVFDDADKKELKAYVKKNGEADIVDTIVRKAKGEL